jgi:putative ABC transport system substrate-binding protein
MSMNRRAFLTSLSLGPLLMASDGKAERDRVFRLGMLWLGPHPPVYHEGVVDALRELGYVEGRNLVVDYRFGGPQELVAQAAELVGLKVDLIHAGSSAGTRAAMAATRNVPIVTVDLETDPVASGFASSVARPAGNLTGIFLNFPEFSGKRLEILKETLPRVSRIAVLWDASMDRSPLSGMDDAARRFNLRLFMVEVRDDSDLESAFKRAIQSHAGVVMVMPSPRLDGYKPQILKLGATYRLPVMTLFAHFTADGGLLSYGPNIHDMLRRSTTYVAKIFEGSKPGDLPIERPAKFDFWVNLKTAKSLHLKIPQSVLAQADEVIR